MDSCRSNKRRLKFLYHGLLGSLVLLLINSCYYDNQEELYDNAPCEVGQVSFKNDIIPILVSRCYTCHDSGNYQSLGDGINLEGFGNFNDYLEQNTSTLLGSVNWSGGGSPMPKNESRMSKCSRDKISIWIDQGRLDN